MLTQIDNPNISIIVRDPDLALSVISADRECHPIDGKAERLMVKEVPKVVQFNVEFRKSGPWIGGG
jgi:hypothetical protein